MTSGNPTFTPLELQSAIVRDPLIVAPNTTVMEAIAQMSGAQSSCHTIHSGDQHLNDLHRSARSSCVVVVDQQQVVGILTERDVVHLTAQQQSLDLLVVAQVMAQPVVSLRESAFTDVFFAINRLQQYRIRHLPILDDQDHLVGLLTHESLRHIARPIDLLRLRLVSEVMTHQVISAPPETSMLAIAQLMATHCISSVVIAEPQIQDAEPSQPASAANAPKPAMLTPDARLIPVGVLTERDLVQFQALGLNLASSTAEAMMSTPIFAVKPEESLWIVQQIMEQRLVHRLVVTGDQGELLGIITQTSLLAVFNPLELYKLTEVLESKVMHLEAEKLALLENRTLDLERQVVERTATLQAKAQQEQLLATIASQIRASLNLQDILDAAVRELRSLLDCDRVAICRFHAPTRGQIVAEAVADHSPRDRVSYNPCFPAPGDGAIRIPILVGQKLWGLLTIICPVTTDLLNSNKIELVRQSTLQLAIAIQQSTTYHQAQAELEERKKTEVRLRESEQRYATLAASVPVGIFRTDAAGNCIYANDRYYQITGLSPESAAGEGWQQGLHPEDCHRIAAAWDQSVRQHTPFQLEYRFQHADGTVVWVYGQAIAEPDKTGQIIGYVGTLTDISDRKQIETERQRNAEQLAISEARFQKLAATLPGILYTSIQQPEHSTQFTYVSPIAAEILELPADTILANSDLVFDLFHPDDLAGYRAALEHSLATLRPFRHEWRIITPSGKTRWLQANSRPERLPDQATLWFGIALDVTDHKQTELALRASEAQNRAILAAIPDLMFRVGADGLFRSQVTQHRGFDILAPEISPGGQHLTEVLPPDIAQREWHYLHQAIQTGELQVYEQIIQVGDRRQHEEVRVIKSGEDEALFMIRDISDRARLEAERQEAEAALQQSERTNRIIIDTMPDLLIQMDRQGNFSRMAGGSSVRVKYPCKSLETPDIESVLPPDLAAQRLYYTHQALETGDLQVYEQIFEFEGEQLYEEVRVAPLNDQEVLIIIRDVTDRKRAEAERLEAEKVRIELKLLEQILDLGLAGYWDWDIPHRREYFSPGFKRMLGYEDSQLPNTCNTWKSLIVAEDLPRVMNSFECHVASRGAIPFYNDMRCHHKDGSIVWVVCSGQVIEWDADGSPLRVIGCHINISDRKQTEADLEQSRAQFQRLVDDIGDKFVVFSHTGTDCIMTYVSDGVESVFGIAKAEAIGSSWVELVNWLPQDMEIGGSSLTQMVNNQIDFHQIEMRFIHPAGGQRTVYISVHPVRDSEGNLIAVEGIAEDITDRKQAEHALHESQQFLQTVLNTAPISVFWKDQASVFLGCNRQFAQAIGVESETEIIGKTDFDFFPNEAANYQADDRWVMESGETRLGIEEPMSLDNNEQRWLETNKAPLRDWAGAVIGVVGTFQDITDRKTAAAQLQGTNEQLMRATRLKDEFLANMSHELRTPLNAILGMTEGLQDQVFGEINQRQRQALQTVERSASHLLELINDILDVAKIEAGQMDLHFTSTAIAPLCKSSLSFVKQQAWKKQIQIETNLPPKLPDLWVDERRVRQVLINLLSNAVKFTPNGGRITLTARIQEEEMTELEPPPLQGITRVKIHSTAFERNLNLHPPDKQESQGAVRYFVQIAVGDTGIGIAPEALKKLFQPFVQIDGALNRQYSGTGLGLALVKSIVELHGGQVGVTSELGVGSCFTISFPCAYSPIFAPEWETNPDEWQTSGNTSLTPSPSPALTSSSSLERSPSPSTTLPLILLAEDNEANILTISSYLEAKGYRMVLAKHGREAISLAQSEHPDLILMDIQMPGMDGLEAIQQIRQDPTLAQMPIIALTALAMEGDRDRCLAAGANDYLSKPVKLKQLATLIGELLAGAGGAE